VLLLIKAIALLPVDLRIHVVVVGRSTDYKRKIIEQAAKLRVSQWIIFLHDVSFVDLPGIYQGAELFVYPSIFEGFGIPIVEALESSIPVIAARGSSLQEAGGPGTIYLDPDNEQEMCETLKEILSNEEVRKRMIEEGRIHVKKFEPEVISELVMKVYKKA
jgi:glycosyltransferase involved in cell wall biosynthesis